jgi:ribonuclease VapC
MKRNFDAFLCRGGSDRNLCLCYGIRRTRNSPVIVDSSVILAIVFREPEAHRLVDRLVSELDRGMSAVNWFETLMVVESRHGAAAADKTLLMLEQLNMEPIPFDRQHILEAQRAWRRYGKRRHAAGLNMADCAAYAAARIAGERCSSKTDITPAQW